MNSNLSKPSGVDWIGDIPRSWNVSRLKDCLEIRNGREVENQEGLVPVYGSGGVFGATDKALFVGDSILFGRKGTIDKPLLVTGEFWTVDTMFYSVLRSQDSIQYLYYVASCIDFKSKQSGSALPSMTQTDLGSFYVPRPEPYEQELIASVLDAETAKIDRAVDLLRQQIKTLEQLKNTIIHEAVTKGLDPAAQLMPSAVDWIGEIPEHWTVSRLKDCLMIFNGREAADESNGDIPVYGSGGAFKWTNDWIHEGKSILFGRKGTIDRPLLVDGKFWTVDTMFWSIPRRNDDIRYLYYVSKCLDYKSVQSGSTLPSMTQTALGGFLIPTPDFEEQIQIADYLDAQVLSFDAAAALKREQLDLLLQWRSSLIFEYVTGKRRVSEAF